MGNNRLGREEKRRVGADMCTESTAVRIIIISALIIIIRTTPPHAWETIGWEGRKRGEWVLRRKRGEQALICAQRALPYG